MKICDKQDYKTKKIAKTSAHVLKLKGIIPPRVDLIPYYCDKCNFWHLTHITVTEYINKVAKSKKRKQFTKI